ncbi:MAG: transposase, partial [Bacilli bacterium]
EGISIGKEEGISIGKEEGISIGKEEVIKEMLKKDLDINFISEITKISTDEITKIQNTMI